MQRTASASALPTPIQSQNDTRALERRPLPILERAAVDSLTRRSAPATGGSATTAEHRAVLDVLRAPAQHDEFRDYAVAQLSRYLAMDGEENQDLSDVERILASRLPPSVFDNSGDGALASAYMLNGSPISLLGYMFWAAKGAVSGAAAMTGAGMQYKGLRAAAEEQRQRLEQAHSLAAATPGLEDTAAFLQDRVDALNKLRQSLLLAYRRHLLGVTMPGGGQLIASTAMLMLQIDRAPTLGGGSTLLPSVGGAVLGTVCGGVLGIFGLAWMGKNAYGCYRAWNTPSIEFKAPPHAEGEELTQHAARQAVRDARMEKYVTTVNRSIRDERIYSVVNLALAAGYTAADAGLMASSLGASVGPKIVWTLLTLASTGYLASEYRWGRRFTCHNMAMPHLDRNYLNNEWHREQTLHVLGQERTDLRGVVKELLDIVAPHHDTGMVLNPWKRVSKKQRYLIWRAAGLEGRIGVWARKDMERTDPLVRQYMVRYTEHEKHNLRTKLHALRANLHVSEKELQNPDVPETVRQVHEEDVDRLWLLNQRLIAMDGLLHVLKGINFATARTAEDKPWNTARLNFLMLHHLMPMFFSVKQIKKHAAWFDISYSNGILGKSITKAHLNHDGMEAAAQAFDKLMEKRFVNLLLTPEVYRYERDAVIEDAKWARRERPDEVRQQLALRHDFERFSFRESAISTHRSGEQAASQTALQESAQAERAASAPLPVQVMRNLTRLSVLKPR